MQNEAAKPGESQAIAILLLEDNPADAKLILHTLEKAGFVVVVDIARGRDAFQQFMGVKPYHLILADYYVPGWTGLNAIRWVRESGYVTPIVLVTGTLSDEEAAECFKEGASDYVLKDKLERLPIAVTHVVKQHRLRTARDQAIKDLRRSEEQYRLLFNSNPQPMWVYDLDSLQFLAVNDAAIAHYGYSREEFLSMTIKDIRPSEMVSALLRNVSESSQRSDLDRSGTWSHRKKDGTLIDVEITSHPIAFEGRRAKVVLANDVTELIKGMSALRRSEERFQKIFQASPEPITISTAEDGCYIDVNESFLRVNGYEREEVLGQYARDTFWVVPQERESFVAALKERGQVRNLEVSFKTSSGETRTGLLSAEMIELDGEPCILAVTKDITEQKRLELQFLQAQKMEAIGRLAGGVAHDFNNLLMIISSSAQLIQDNLGKQEVIDRYSTQIRKASEKAAALTRQLLAFSRKQMLLPVILDLNVVVSDLCKMLPRLLGEDIEVILSLAPDLGTTSADRGQIEQVIMNLAVNARDAMPSGGRLTIETHNVEIGAENLEAHGVRGRAGKYVMLAISDTGIGMDDQIMSRIFEPFFTTKEQGKGTGLGLATVYGIVKQSEGWIWVYSEPGKGSSFKVYLPRTESEIAPEPVIREIESVAVTGTILLVEDERGLREVTSDYLQSKGYRVLEAEDGPKAMEIVSTFEGTIDVLITDMVMPGFGGPRLAEQALAARPMMAVIFVSGYAERAVNDEIGGADAVFLQKPFSLNLLAQKIAALIERRTR